MSCEEIVAHAVKAGMDGVALTDHQSARNTPAFFECARRAHLACLAGLEVETAEEVHTLALFDTVETALAMTDYVYAGLPKRVNDPNTFGDQPVIDADGGIVELEWRLLAAATRHPLGDVAAKTHALGGLLIAAHIDRAHHSVIGNLGTIPEGIFDAVELSRTADLAEWSERAAPYAITRSSDAHNLCDIAKVWTEADCDFSVAGLKSAFAKRTTSVSPRLTTF